jgi:YfiH family protein
VDADVLTIPGLASLPGLVHGFSTTALGSMALAPSRGRFARRLSLPPERLTRARAVHGARVVRVDDPVEAVPGVDGLVTDRPDLPLLLTCADCYAIVLYDPGRRALAVAHAGWRGTAAGIAGEAVATLGREFGCRPAELAAGIGPGICGNCYEVGDEVAASFDRAHLKPGRPGHPLLDLAAANRAQLEAAGMRSGSIHAHGACTRETSILHSHRREGDGSRFACLAAIVPASAGVSSCAR